MPAAEGRDRKGRTSRKEDLSNPYKRPGKGYAYQYLMGTLATISGNVRKLKTFIDRLGGPRDPKSPERATRAPRRNPKQRLAMKRAPQDGRSHRHPART
ncbi:MAG: hypothetical protein JWQ59_228 [Cryobacterium sp.]|nr:hypothetical protein [Cryobacterium sp.]